MRNFYGIMAITALIIYLVSAVLNQCFIWGYWKYIVQSIWEFIFVFGSFHYYASSRYKMWYWDVTGVSLIGFASVNAIHSLWSVAVWSVSERTITEVLDGAFEEYNLIFMLLASGVAITCGLLYLINLPYLLHKK